MAWAWCVLFACPALPAVDREMSMSMSNPSRVAQELPSHFIPLSYLFLAVVYSMYPPHPPSAGVSGCANRSGFPHSKLLAVPVVPVLPLSCHPTPHSRPTPPWAHPESPRNSPPCRGKRR